MQTDKKMCHSWFGWILARAWETQHSLVKEYAVILKKKRPSSRYRMHEKLVLLTIWMIPGG